MQPSAGDRARISGALRARLGDAALPAESLATATSVWHPALAKLLAVAGAVGIVGAAAFFVWEKPGSAPTPVLPSHQGAVGPALAPAPLPPPDASAAPVLGLPQPEAPVRRAQDHLAQEVAILSRATSALHAGRAASALKALDEHQRKFPRGLLSEERRAARAQALCVLGRRREAELEIGRLARTSPQSPNIARAKEVCGSGFRGR